MSDLMPTSEPRIPTRIPSSDIPRVPRIPNFRAPKVPKFQKPKVPANAKRIIGLFKKIAKFKGLLTLLIILTILSLAIWYGFPYIAVDDKSMFVAKNPRILAIAIVVFIGCLFYILKMRSRKMSSRVSSEEEDEDRAIIESIDFFHIFSQAKRFIHAHKVGYLPTFLIIGKAKIGKTSLLKLNCENAEEITDDFPEGLSDIVKFIFTTEGIFIKIDEYVLQDYVLSEKILISLRRYHLKHAIRKSVLCICVNDIKTLDLEGAKGSEIYRTFLDSLRLTLGFSLPSYLLINKADSIAGFVDFFESYNAEEHKELFGVTLDNEKYYTQKVERDYLKLVRYLSLKAVPFLAKIKDDDKAKLIFYFPLELLQLLPSVKSFTKNVFEGSVYKHAHNLQGVYFVSIEQESASYNFFSHDVFNKLIFE